MLRKSRARHGSRRRRTTRVLVGLAVVVVALGLLAIPLLSVPDDAQVAKTELSSALSALRSGDTGAARRHVASAREHVDAAQDDATGLGGDVWSAIPFLGTPVDDARHLVQALDDATSVAEIADDLYPRVAGQDATLFRDSRIDRETLDRVIAGAHEISDHLKSADRALAEVKGTTPVVGATIDARRDAAVAQLSPILDGLSSAEPMLDQLPSFLGFEGKRTYLIAMLNPAELRYSGGAALSFAPMSWDEGELQVGHAISPLDDPMLSTPISWPKVKGNRFHHNHDIYLVNSTFAPSWSVSGKELLRAWKAARDKLHDGVIAVDVVALAHLVGSTGPLNVPGYGELTEDNLVKALVGSYDEYYPDATAQDSRNTALLPAFQAQFFGGGNYVAKAQALGEAAAGRHFATYFRNPDLQAAFAGLGLDGDLATPAGDYFGVFTQNTNIGKTDYYQRRNVSLDVRLHADGSATDRLDVLIDNDTTPYPFPEPDPRTGYFTRWAGMALGVFLPEDVSLNQSSLRGETTDPEVHQFRGHGFVAHQMTLEPSGTGRLKMAYDVPHAASADGEDSLTYHLAFDPQGMVHPASVAVTVHLPAGYRASALPEGWTAKGDTLRFRSAALDASQDWTIPLEASN